MRATLTDAPAMILLSEPRPFEWQRERRIGWGVTDRMQIVGMASLGKRGKRRKRALPVAAFAPEAADTTVAAQTPANAAALVAAEAPLVQDAATALVPNARTVRRFQNGPDIYDADAEAAETDQAYEGQAGLYALACGRRRRRYAMQGYNAQGVGFLPLIAGAVSLASSLFSKKPKPPAPAPAPAPVAAAPQASNKFPVSLPLLAAGALAVYLLARKA